MDIRAEKPADSRELKRFRATVRAYYRAHGRSMPWRERPTLYNVIVSEIMLQQTQVSRVMGKFASFTEKFPDFKSLAEASTREVLQEWSGLGYNRRALYLKRIAEQIVSGAELQEDVHALHQRLLVLPGIGPNTAGSIMAFAYNIPTPFIETNIRSAFIHFFFPAVEKRAGRKACKKISDDQLMPLIERALADPKNRRDPREWYYALMDYGACLKKRLPNPSRRSAHHARQSPFKGSNRELRAKILRSIMEKSGDEKAIVDRFKGYPAEQVKKNLTDLADEGFLNIKSSIFNL